MDTYKRLCTEFYDLDKPSAPLDELKFYIHYVEEAHGAILEPMCGSGRFLIPILERGFEIEGLDASPHMLAACRQKCAAKGLKPKLYQQFLHEMSVDKKYSLIFIPSGSFGLITDVDQAKQCLRILYDHLLPQGKLVFEVETLFAIPKELGQWVDRVRVHTRLDDSLLTLSVLPTFDPKAQVLRSLCRYDVIRDDEVVETESEDFWVRLYGQHEMDNWLVEAGFGNVMRLKAYSREVAGERDGVIIYECYKTR